MTDVRNSLLICFCLFSNTFSSVTIAIHSRLYVGVDSDYIFDSTVSDFGETNSL